MANEARMTVSLNINKGNLKENVNETFVADLTNAEGPEPGYLDVPETGVNITFTNLTDPGLCIFKNVGSTYTVTLGISDGTEFYPLFDIKPGRFAAGEISEWIGTSLDSGGTGTGTYDTGTYYLHAIGINGAGALTVKCYGR